MMKFSSYTRNFSLKVTINNSFTSLLNTNENKEKVINKLKSVKSLRPPEEDKLVVGKTAAILVPLVEVQGEPAILFTKRSKFLTSHRGQVSFPGGNCDKQDEGPEETALRECWEEIGIPSSSVEIWATLPSLASSRTTEKVNTATPIVGFIKNFDQNMNILNICNDEVELVFYVKFSVLCNPDNCKYTQFRAGSAYPWGSTGFSMPMLDVMPFPIWGLTSIVTSQVLQAVVPKELYTHKVLFQSPLR